MKGKKLVFVSVYCQNYYQEERVKNFAKNKNSKIINLSFNTKNNKPNFLENKLSRLCFNEKNFISRSDEVWILVGSLDSNSPENKVKMYSVENYSKSLNKYLKYFYIHQSGRYVGQAKSIERKEIFNQDFYNYLSQRKSHKNEL